MKIVRLTCHQSLQLLVGRDLGESADDWLAWYRKRAGARS